MHYREDYFHLYYLFTMLKIHTVLLSISIGTISLGVLLFVLPLSYTYIGSHYFGGAQILIPSLQLLTWEDTPFQENLWKEHGTSTEGKKIRGMMMKNLLETKNFSQMSKEEVYTLLGNDTGYFHHDHIIAYSIYHAQELYTLGFPGNIPTLEKTPLLDR